MKTYKVVLRHRQDGSNIYTSFTAKNERDLKKEVRKRFNNNYMIVRVS